MWQKSSIDSAAFVQSGALVLTALIALIVGIGAFAPPPPIPGPPGPDKMIHLFAFAAIVLPTALVAPRHLRWVVPGAILYGAAIEVFQPFFGRQAELLDLVADIAGVGGAAISGRVLAGLFQTRS